MPPIVRLSQSPRKKRRRPLTMARPRLPRKRTKIQMTMKMTTMMKMTAMTPMGIVTIPVKYRCWPMIQSHDDCVRKPES